MAESTTNFTPTKMSSTENVSPDARRILTPKLSVDLIERVIRTSFTI